MIISPYQTLVCQAYDLTAIERGLKLAQLEGGLFAVQTPNTPLYLISPLNREIPPFGHPLLWDDKIFIDARGMIRVDNNAALGYVVTQQAEFEFQVNRAKLTWYAKSQNVDDLAVLGDIAPVTFARFVAENLVRALGLGPEEQALATLTLVFYYFCMFRDPGELEEAEMNRMIGKIGRMTYLTSEWIYQRKEPLRYMGGIQDLVAVLHGMIENPRIKSLNAASLITYVRGGWFGMNAVETMGVALEHPPTFLAMVVASLKDRSYRNARLAKVVQTNDKKNSGKQFLANTAHLGI